MNDDDTAMYSPRLSPARWPRLMSIAVAAEYLSISATSVREKGPAPVRFGKRRLYDIRHLDRWADSLFGQPVNEWDVELEEARSSNAF